MGRIVTTAMGQNRIKPYSCMVPSACHAGLRVLASIGPKALCGMDGKSNLAVDKKGAGRSPADANRYNTAV